MWPLVGSGGAVQISDVGRLAPRVDFQRLFVGYQVLSGIRSGCATAEDNPVLNCLPNVKDIGNVARRRSVIRAERDPPWNALALRYRRRGLQIAPSRARIAKDQESFHLLGQDVARKVDVRQREKRTPMPG